MQWLYTLFILSILVTFGGGSWLRLRAFWSQWRKLTTAWLTVSVSWIVLEILAVASGWWSYSNDYVVGLSILGVPIEVLVFLFVGPLACMVVWYAIGQAARGAIKARYAQRALLIFAGMLVFYLVVHINKEHTLIVTALALGVTRLLYCSSCITRQAFWYWNGFVVLYWLMMSVLLADIVAYDESPTSGVHIGALPLENYLYTFGLLNMFMLVFHTQSLRTAYREVFDRRPRIKPAIMPKAIQTKKYHPRPADSENDTI